MDLSLLTTWWPILTALVGVIITWVVSDTSFKSKITSLEEKVSTNKVVAETRILDADTKLGVLIIQNARSEQDRQELHRLVEKLEASKASKDVVDGFKNEINTLKTEMANRFDRLERQIERLIEYKILKFERASEEE